MILSLNLWELSEQQQQQQQQQQQIGLITKTPRRNYV